jgi:hypothetical protein
VSQDLKIKKEWKRIKDRYQREEEVNVDSREMAGQDKF